MNIVKIFCQVHCEDVEHTEKVAILPAVKATSHGVFIAKGLQWSPHKALVTNIIRQYKSTKSKSVQSQWLLL